MKDWLFGALSVIGATIAHALGSWDSALAVLVGMMAADYITGLMIALIWHKSAKTAGGAFSSNASIKGLFRKLGMLMLVWVGAMVDRAIGVDYVRTAVILFLIANEGFSVLENTAVMGIPYPTAIIKALEILKDSADPKDGEQDEP